jgi:hypothetical protein
MQRGDTWLTLIGVDLDTKAGKHAAEITFHYADGSFDTIAVTRHCPRGDDVLQNTYPLIGLP